MFNSAVVWPVSPGSDTAAFVGRTLALCRGLRQRRSRPLSEILAGAYSRNITLSIGAKGNIESDLEWRHRDLSVRCEVVGRGVLPPRPSSSAMSPVGYSSAMLSSKSPPLTNRSNRGSTLIWASRENGIKRQSAAARRWLPGSRLTRRNRLHFYAPANKQDTAAEARLV